jgi:general secretion pathway protein K
MRLEMASARTGAAAGGGLPLRSHRRQRGAAILAAMLTVTLVATFAAAAMWQQFRAVEVEAAERARVQSSWILTGALDWSRLILREDARPSAGGDADHLAEPWAVPLQEARLSTFLAADKAGVADASMDPGNAFLSGQIVDMQARLNVTNLLEEGKISETGVRSFQRLFELLGLPPGQVGLLAEGLRAAYMTGAGGQAPLLPQTVDQLLWLGLPETTLAALQPYITILPQRTQANLNTASAEVISAAANGMSLADAQRLVTARASTHFRNLEEATRLLPNHAQAMSEGTVGVRSSFFEVHGRLRLDDIVVEERSLLHRNGTTVITLQRERGVAGSSGLPPTAALR